MKTVIVEVNYGQVGICPQCGKTTQLYDVELKDGAMESLIEEPLCHDCAVDTQEMVEAEMRIEKKIEKILKKW